LAVLALAVLALLVAPVCAAFGVFGITVCCGIEFEFGTGVAFEAGVGLEAEAGVGADGDGEVRGCRTGVVWLGALCVGCVALLGWAVLLPCVPWAPPP
jgi:hypothetical protein